MTATVGCLGSIIVLGAVYAVAQAAGIPAGTAAVVAWVGLFAALIAVGFKQRRRQGRGGTWCASRESST